MPLPFRLPPGQRRIIGFSGSNFQCKPARFSPPLSAQLSRSLHVSAGIPAELGSYTAPPSPILQVAPWLPAPGSAPCSTGSVCFPSLPHSHPHPQLPADCRRLSPRFRLQLPVSLSSFSPSPFHFSLFFPHPALLPPPAALLSPCNLPRPADSPQTHRKFAGNLERSRSCASWGNVIG